MLVQACFMVKLDRRLQNFWQPWLHSCRMPKLHHLLNELVWPWDTPYLGLTGARSVNLWRLAHWNNPVQVIFTNLLLRTKIPLFRHDEGSKQGTICKSFDPFGNVVGACAACTWSCTGNLDCRWSYGRSLWNPDSATLAEKVGIKGGNLLAFGCSPDCARLRCGTPQLHPRFLVATWNLCFATQQSTLQLLLAPTEWGMLSPTLLQTYWIPHGFPICHVYVPETPLHILFITANSAALNPNIVRLGRVLPYIIHDWKVVKFIKWMTDWMKVVCQK